MAANKHLPGTPVFALKRPQHEVELFHFSLYNDCVLVASETTSQSFICYKIIDEFLQNKQNESTKWAVVLTDDDVGATSVGPLIKVLNQLLPKKPVIFPSLDEAARLPHLWKHNVILTTTNRLQHCIRMGYMHTENISVVILLTTLTNTTNGHNPPAVLESLRKDVKPRIIGLMQLSLCDISTASDLKLQLELIEASFDLPVYMSKNLLAMNAFGEEIGVQLLPYSSKNVNPTERVICKNLMEMSDFFHDLSVIEISESIGKLQVILAWSIEVLTIYGLWSFSFTLECIQNTLSRMLSKENHPCGLLAIETCITQFHVVQKLVSTQQAVPVSHSRVISEILERLAPYQAYCNVPTTLGECEAGVSLPSEQMAREMETGQGVGRVACDEGLQVKASLCKGKDEADDQREEKSGRNGNDTSSNKHDFVEKRVEKLNDRTRFRCMIVTRSKAFARMLSKLINYVSSCNEKFSFLKSGCVILSRNASPEEEERTESVLQAVLQGIVNTAVTTLEYFPDLSLTTFNVIVYFGLPATYQEYFQMKNKIRGLRPKLMLLFHEDFLTKCKENLQVFNDVESEIGKRVSDYISEEKKVRWLKCLEKEPPCDYAPFGDDGPSVSMESSIHLINRYCRRISRGDFCNLYAQFITERRNVAENCVEIATKLYLPLGSNCRTLVEGPAVRVTSRNDQDVEFGILKSRMLTSLECVKVLHARGKMDDDLDLIGERFVDANNEKGQNFELEDEGKGRAGTNKRKRAYEIKMPSFLHDNMPRAKEPSFLYKIEFGDPTIYKHSKSGRLQRLLEPEFELGILSRKQLPKLPSFLIHTCKSDITVCLKANDRSEKTLRIDDSTLTSIRLFHHYVFKELYKLDSQSTTLSESDGYLAVPLLPNTTTSNHQIHFEFLQEFASFFQSPTDPEVKLKSVPRCEDFNFFENKIVRRLNRSVNQTHYSRYFVVEVCKNLTPKSPFPDLDVASTFVEYYQKRYGITVDLEQPLLLVQHLPTQVNFIVPRHRPQDEGEVASSVTEKSSGIEIHLIPHLCSILPLSASAWSLARFLPAVMYRLEALLRAHEMKLKIQLATRRSFSSNPEDFGSCENDEKQTSNCEISDERDCPVARGGNDDNRCGDVDGICGDGDGGDNDNEDGLDISLILHSLTAKSVGQQFHSEQLEVLGDSFLKYEVSLELFLSDPERDEWTLSAYRSHLVSNDMLSTQGRRLGIPGYISVTPPDLTNTTLPPGFILEPPPGVNDVKKRALNLYTHQVLGDKHVANCVEALLAATLVSCGRNSARRFLTWLGVMQCTLEELDGFSRRFHVHDDPHAVHCADKQVKMNEERECKDLQDAKCVCDREEITAENLQLPDPNAKASTRAFQNFEHIETELGYSFNNKLLLLQALTHNSYLSSLSLVAETYQKMEFLGDAILDYLVTMYLFENFPQLNHGDVTDFRSALVNNFTLAFLSVKKNFHQSLRYLSPPLLHVISQFLEFLEEQELKQGASWKTSVDAFVVGKPEVEESSVEVPKVLGDVFEAVVCAVFLDCGMDLDQVWKVFFPMFLPFIDYYKDNLPRSPVRVLKETFPDGDNVIFSLARLTLSRQYKSSVRVAGYGKFEAIGRTPKIAKASVARQALQHIQNTNGQGRVH